MMHKSIDAFDLCFEGEAQRMAVCMLPIIRDTAELPSILTQLGLKGLYFYSVCPEYNPSIGLPFSGLAIPKIGKTTSTYIPRLDFNPNVKPRMVSFEEWGTKPVIVEEAKNISINRQQLVLMVANTMSGLIDNKLNKEFNELILDNCMGWVDENQKVDIELIPVAFPSVRHIAFELLHSLKEQAPQYFPEEEPQKEE